MLDANDLANLQVRWRPDSGTVRLAWKPMAGPTRYKLFHTKDRDPEPDLTGVLLNRK